MQPDYSSLLAMNPDYFPSWERYYNNNLTYPQNILNLCKQVSPLPYDFYNIITAYFLIPSAIAKRVPYLFFYGVSGSGKSTFCKLAAKMHGVTPLVSTTTYAAIRNDLREKKTKWILVPSKKAGMPPMSKPVEANTFMSWEDIDLQTFKKQPNIYVLLKCGYDKATDTIKISGENKGTNEKFRCFCPKAFSSIQPIHATEEYSELRRRLIVIPTKKIENTELDLLDIDNIDWTDFSSKFNEFWDINQAELWFITRSAVSKVKGLTSQQKAISLDLIATGVSAGIWHDENEAVKELKECFNWLKQDVQIEKAPLETLLVELIENMEKDAKGIGVCIYSKQLKGFCENWYQQGYLMDRPSNKEILRIMNEKGYRTNTKGQWIPRIV